MSSGHRILWILAFVVFPFGKLRWGPIFSWVAGSNGRFRLSVISLKSSICSQHWWKWQCLFFAISILFQPFNAQDWYRVVKQHIHLQSVWLSENADYPENCNISSTYSMRQLITCSLQLPEENNVFIIQKQCFIWWKNVIWYTAISHCAWVWKPRGYKLVNNSLPV